MKHFFDKRRDLLGILVAIGSALIFGLYPAATRGAYAEGANAVFIILFTTFFRATTMALFCFATQRRLFAKKNDIKIAMQNGFFQTASIVGILGGMAFLPGPVVITIMFSYTLMLYLFLIFKKEEKLDVVILLTVIAAFIGLCLVVGAEDKFINLPLTGLGLAGLAALATATRMYRYGQLLKHSDPAVVGAETFIFVLIFCCALIVYEIPIWPTSLQGWLWAVLAAFSLSLGNFGMFYGIQLIGSFKFAFFIKLEPVFGAIFAFLLIGEILNPSQYVGVGIIVASLFIYQALQVRFLVKTKTIK
jgi:drug/metabolite transporter (DMT)-like permease